MATPNRFKIYKKTAINLVSESNSQPRESGFRNLKKYCKKIQSFGFYGSSSKCNSTYPCTVFPYNYVLYYVK